MVSVAQSADPAFHRTFTEGPLRRALLCDFLGDLCAPGLRVDELGNGGVEISIVHDTIERRFRLKLASLDPYGMLAVTASSDSILTPQPRERALWDEPAFLDPTDFEQWVLAYVLHPQTRTFTLVQAGRVVGKLNEYSPFKLILADRVSFKITPPAPPSFYGNDDDLNLGHQDDEGGEGSEGAAG